MRHYEVICPGVISGSGQWGRVTKPHEAQVAMLRALIACSCLLLLGCDRLALHVRAPQELAKLTDVASSPASFETNQFVLNKRLNVERADAAIARVADVENLPRWADVIHALRLHNTIDQGRLTDKTQSLLDYVLNANAAHQRFGEQIHFVSRNGVSILSWDPAIRQQGEPHPDKTVCVLAQLGVEKDRPLSVGTQAFRVADIVTGAMNNFSWEQESAFTVVAMLHYLPGSRGWENKYGEAITFDEIGQKLCDDCDAQIGSCFCTHNLFGLVMLLRADEGAEILSSRTRTQIEDRVKKSLSRFLDCYRTGNPQEPDLEPLIGSRAKVQNPNDKYIRVTSVVITSHYLEVLAFAPDYLVNKLDAEGPTRLALEFLLRQIEVAPSDIIVESFGPYSHAANAIALFNGNGSRPRNAEAVSSLANPSTFPANEP